MMDFKELSMQLNVYFAKLQQEVTKIFQFVIWRLKNYGQMTVAEQIAYPCVLLGLVLIFASFVLMML